MKDCEEERSSPEDRRPRTGGPVMPHHLRLRVSQPCRLSPGAGGEPSARFSSAGDSRRGDGVESSGRDRAARIRTARRRTASAASSWPMGIRLGSASSISWSTPSRGAYPETNSAEYRSRRSRLLQFRPRSFATRLPDPSPSAFRRSENAGSQFPLSSRGGGTPPGLIPWPPSFLAPQCPARDLPQIWFTSSATGLPVFSPIWFRRSDNLQRASSRAVPRGVRGSSGRSLSCSRQSPHFVPIGSAG
jgi:hypothetical protein